MVGNTFLIVLNFVFIQYSTASSNYLSFIEKCNDLDTTCITRSSQIAIPHIVAGIPEIDLPSMDPLRIKYVDSSKKSLKFIVTDIALTGLDKCNATSVVHDKANGKLIVKCLCTTYMPAKYTLDGVLAIIKVTGNGNMMAILRDVLYTITVNVEYVTRNGKHYWHNTSWGFTHEYFGKASLTFENLLPGNPILAAVADKMIKKNTNQVVDEIGYPIVKAIVSAIVKNVIHFFAYSPFEDIFLKF